MMNRKELLKMGDPYAKRMLAMFRAANGVPASGDLPEMTPEQFLNVVRMAWCNGHDSGEMGRTQFGSPKGK